MKPAVFKSLAIVVAWASVLAIPNTALSISLTPFCWTNPLLVFHFDFISDLVSARYFLSFGADRGFLPLCIHWTL